MAYTDIDNAGLFYNTILYTGNGSTQSITGVGFQPDLVWLKNRTDGTAAHRLTDSVRGATKEIYSNLTNAQYTDTGGVTAFDSDGFSLGSTLGYNQNTHLFVSFNFKESATAGIDIVSYTGNGSADRSISHSLGTEPDFIMTKIHSETMNWPTYSKAMGNGVAFLDISDAWTDHSSYLNYWYPSGMGSSTFGVGDNDNTNKNTTSVISYLFSNRQGFLKAGKYKGNGSNDGTFVYTGFRPAFVLLKRTDSATEWQLIDNRRSNQGGLNVIDEVLAPSTNDADYDDGSNWFADFLSNGFKLRNGGAAGNNSGSTFLYLAIAESPFVNSKGVPTNAR